MQDPKTAALAPSAQGGSHTMPLLVGALAAFSFVCMDAVIKAMAVRYDALQLSFFRFAGGSVFALLLWAWQRSKLPPRAAWRGHIARSLFLLVSLVGYFHALTLLPLAQTVTISYLAPIFVSVLAVPVLKEQPSGSIRLALGLGLAGIVISVLPELRGTAGMSNARLLGMASATAAAFSFACVMLLARRQSRRDSVWTILLLQTMLPMLLLAAPAAWAWKPVLHSDVGLILLAGALGTLGLLSLTHALKHLEASRVAPLEYSGFVWAAGLGWLLFGEIPTLTTAAAAALIIAGCLMLLRR